MDLNQLLANHRRALHNQRSACSLQDRNTYFDLVGYYAERIHKHRLATGLPHHSLPNDGRSPQE
ncbi:hypothetical protein [Aurantiacibacter gilvus]|uniref:Integrase n=1 Tax=Aurantiacibacter gilvus TaxID=3139141 RepID=A0ABU9IGG4_9SPHN